MSYAVILTQGALEDLPHLEDFLVEAALKHGDFDLPRRAVTAIAAIRHQREDDYH